MRFLFEVTTLTYRMRHAIAVELSKIFPGSSFAAFESSHGNVARKYLEEQTDIKYEFIRTYEDLKKKALQEEIDFKLLADFEQTLPEKSLWRFIAVDRGLGHQFVKGVYLPKTYIQTINTQENILKIVSGLVRFYAQALSDFKPDVVIPAPGQNSVTCPVLEQTCRNQNALYLMPEILRVQNYMALTDNRMYTFTQINEIYKQLMKGEFKLDLSAGEKLYQEIVGDPDDKKRYCNYVSLSYYKPRWQWLKLLYRSMRAVKAQLLRWLRDGKQRRQKDAISRQPNTTGTLLYNIWYSVLAQYRRVQLMNPDFYAQYNPKQKYIYFPLHCTNEYSTQVKGTMWINQLPIIEALAKSIPFDWKIVVKEHPGILVWRVRPKSFYDEIKSYSNVQLIPTNTDSSLVIDNAQLVINISGSTGWEAILRGKPVIGFEDSMFDALDLSRRCTDFKQLSTAIHEEVRRVENILSSERKRRIISLLAVMIKYGFWIDHPGKVGGEVNVATGAEERKIARIIAQKMKEYLIWQGQKK